MIATADENESKIGPVLPLTTEARLLMDVAWHLRLSAAAMELRPDPEYACVLAVSARHRQVLVVVDQLEDDQRFRMIDSETVRDISYDGDSELAAGAVIAFLRIPPAPNT